MEVARGAELIVLHVGGGIGPRRVTRSQMAVR
jgi:hypothetical protein